MVVLSSAKKIKNEITVVNEEALKHIQFVPVRATFVIFTSQLKIIIH